MAFVLTTSIILMNNSRKIENIQRKRLRDASNPMDMPDNSFKECFRVNKEAFMSILTNIEPHIKFMTIPLAIELAATLRFFAEGSFQRSVGNDSIIAMHRSTFSKSFSKMIVILEKILCNHWIKLPSDPQYIQNSKTYFFEKVKIPGVVGCIDGTHIRVVKPGNQDFAKVFRFPLYHL